MPPSPHWREAFDIKIPTSRHPDIRRLKQQTPKAQLHGGKVWNASLVLMDYLEEFPFSADAHILEIGCGWGTASVYCATQGAARIVALDADAAVLPYLDVQAAMNDVEIDSIAMDIADLTVEQLEMFDLIIGTDICFWPEQETLLENLIDKALQAKVPRLVFTDPGRPNFRNLVERISPHLNCRFTDWSVPAPHNCWGLVLDISAGAEEMLLATTAE